MRGLVAHRDGVGGAVHPGGFQYIVERTASVAAHLDRIPHAFGIAGFLDADAPGFAKRGGDAIRA